MKQVIQGTNTIVVVGAWNIAIFSQDWVKNNILPEENFKVLFPSMIGCSLKFQTDILSFCIEGERLMFEILNEADADKAYVEIARVLRIILRKLSHTPVRALGTNFVYDSDSKFPVLESLSDNERLGEIITLIGNGVKSQGLIRKFSISENEELTIRLESTEGGTNRVDFNFNYNIAKAEDVLNILGDEDQLIVKNQKLANQIVEDVYGK